MLECYVQSPDVRGLLSGDHPTPIPELGGPVVEETDYRESWLAYSQIEDC